MHKIPLYIVYAVNTVVEVILQDLPRRQVVLFALFAALSISWPTTGKAGLIGVDVSEVPDGFTGTEVTLSTGLKIEAPSLLRNTVGPVPTLHTIPAPTTDPATIVFSMPGITFMPVQLILVAEGAPPSMLTFRFNGMGPDFTIPYTEPALASFAFNINDVLGFPVLPGDDVNDITQNALAIVGPVTSFSITSDAGAFGFQGGTFNMVGTAAVAEPGTLLAFCAGLLGLVVLSRRRSAMR